MAYHAFKKWAGHTMKQRAYLLTAFCSFSIAFFILSSSVHASFQQRYERGKLLLRQKQYADAIRDLYRAVYHTPRGKKHFGAHYFLALAYYRLGNITQAMKSLRPAKGLIKNSKQRFTYKLLISKIRNLFGSLRIIPEVDPDSVGRLLLRLEVKNAFSNPQKIRAFRIIRKFWSTKGIVLKGSILYLPKGEYKISIARTQCLRLGLTLGGATIDELSVGAQTSTLALKAVQSCQCEGGQVLKKKGEKVFCGCPDKTVWFPKKNRCEIPAKVIAKPTWIGRNWGWVLGGVVVAGAAGAGVAVVVATMNAPKPVVVRGTLFKK